MASKAGMMIEWRTVQLFLSEDGVHEVELDLDDNRRMRCSCPKYSRISKCKHIKWIDNKIIEQGGHYNIQVPSEVDELEARFAFDSAETFREFVLKYAKIEVL